MAQAIPKRCTRCSKIATHAGRCDDHQRKPWENKSANSRALTGRQRENLKIMMLHIRARCAVCDETRNLQLDHIIEIADGGHPTDPDNLQLLCKPHHDAKTKAMRAARANRPRTY